MTSKLRQTLKTAAVGLFLIFLTGNSYGQDNKAFGVCFSERAEPVFATVIAQDSQAQIVDYAMTDSKGSFSLTVPTLPLYIIANSLGYLPDTVLLTSYEQPISFSLAKSSIPLKEIEVKDSKIRTFSTPDTTSYQADSLTDSESVVVEDLIRNIPGVQITKEGAIKMNGKYISALLVDGDDLLENRYTLMSRNLKAEHISSISVYQRYQPNMVMRSVSDSEGIALDLKLKESSKNIWNGNTTIRNGLNREEWIYNYHVDLFNFNPLFKTFSIINSNRIGKVADESVELGNSSTNILQLRSLAPVRFNRQPQINIPIDHTPYFDNGRRHHINSTSLAKINAVNLLKIGLNAARNADQQVLRTNSVFLPNTEVNTRSEIDLNTSDIDFSAQWSKRPAHHKWSLESRLTYLQEKGNNTNRLLFNALPNSTTNELNTRNVSFQNLFSTRTGEQKAVQVHSYGNISSGDYQFVTDAPFTISDQALATNKQTVQHDAHQFGIQSTYLIASAQSRVVQLTAKSAFHQVKVSNPLFLDQLPITNPTTARASSFSTAAHANIIQSITPHLVVIAEGGATAWSPNDRRTTLLPSGSIRVRYEPQSPWTYTLTYQQSEEENTVDQLIPNTLLIDNRNTIRSTLPQTLPTFERSLSFYTKWENKLETAHSWFSSTYIMNRKGWSNGQTIDDETITLQPFYFDNQHGFQLRGASAAFIPQLRLQLKANLFFDQLSGPIQINTTNLETTRSITTATLTVKKTVFKKTVLEYNYSPQILSTSTEGNSFSNTIHQHAGRIFYRHNNFAVETKLTVLNLDDTTYPIGSFIVRQTIPRKRMSPTFTFDIFNIFGKTPFRTVSALPEQFSNQRIDAVPISFLVGVNFDW